MQLLDYIWTCFLVSGKQHMFFCLDGSRSMSYRFVGALPLRCVSLFHTTYTPWHKPNPMANAQQRFEKGKMPECADSLKEGGVVIFETIPVMLNVCMYKYIYICIQVVFTYIYTWVNLPGKIGKCMIVCTYIHEWVVLGVNRG